MQRDLAAIDLKNARPAWLWNSYSDGSAERLYFEGWWDGLVHPRWGKGTYWKIELSQDGTPFLMSLLGDRMLLTGDRTWTHYRVSADVRQYHSLNINPSVNLAYRQACLNGLVARVRDVRSYYLYCLENYDRLTLYRVEDDSLVVLDQKFVHLDPTRFYRLDLWCSGSRIRCGFEGKHALEASDCSYLSGWCGLRANSKCGFRDIRVTADSDEWSAYLILRDREQRALEELRATYPAPAAEKRFVKPLQGPGQLIIRGGDAKSSGFYWISDFRLGGRNSVAAATMDGEVRWLNRLEGPLEHEDGTSLSSAKSYPVRRSGCDDLLILDGGKVKLYAGENGELLAERPYPLAGPLMGHPGKPAPIGYAYAVQFRHPPAPMDIIILDADSGGGRNVWCFDSELNPRWTLHLPFAFGHNMFFSDVDRDGRDEAMLGHCLVNGDGEIVWSIDEMHYAPYGAMGIHADSVVIGDLEGNGTLRLASTSGDDGVLFVDARNGEILRRDRIGHAQGLSAARYVRDVPGIQVLAGTRHRAYGIFVLYDGRGNRLHRWQPDMLNQNGIPVNWRGDGEELLHLSSPLSGHGLFDWRGRLVVPFPEELARLEVGSVVVHPAGDDPRDRLIGVGEEDIVVWGPGAPLPADRRRIYNPRREYWRGRTIGVISFPGWVERG